MVLNIGTVRILEDILAAEANFDISPNEDYGTQMRYVDALARHQKLMAMLRYRHPDNFQEMLESYKIECRAKKQDSRYPG